MGRWLFVAMVLSASPAVADDWLPGTWHLQSASVTENGKTKEYLGVSPVGQLMFDNKGHFSEIILRSDLPKFASNNRATGSAAENSAIVQGSIGYFGSYKLENDTVLRMQVEHSTYPNWAKSEQVRVVHHSGKHLTWENAAASAGGSNVTLVFERLD